MGRQGAIANLLIALLPLAVGVSVAVAIGFEPGTGLRVALGLSVASLACLLALKLPALRSGRWFGFGPAQAAPGRRWLWWLSLGLLALSGVFVAGALRVT
jgi:hypothetical protein